MTDNDIIKALECCQYEGVTTCRDCPMFYTHKFDNEIDFDCGKYIYGRALDLINRQQAEIERLQKFKSYFDSLYGINLEVEGWHENGNTISFDEFYDSAIEDMDSAEHHISYIIKCVKSEAIKEFAERVKQEINFPLAVWKVFDNLVKEMTENDFKTGDEK